MPLNVNCGAAHPPPATQGKTSRVRGIDCLPFEPLHDRDLSRTDKGDFKPRTAGRVNITPRNILHSSDTVLDIGMKLSVPHGTKN